LVGLWGGCGKREKPSPDQILRISQRNEPATLDPQLATLPDEFFILRALSEGLVTPNPDGGTPLPGVAERWETSADGLTWTFHLRPNAKWSNGEPVTARDFVYSAKRALSATTAAPKASLFYVLRHARDHLLGREPDFSRVGISARDAHTLVLTLEHPSADLLSLLASGPWLPVHQATVERHGRLWTRANHFVGNGPFTLVEWLPNQRIVVRKNPGYWDAPAVRIDTIHMLSFDSSDSEERTFRAGQLDVSITVPFSKLESYRQANPALMHTVPLHETRYITLNVTRPPLNDVRVRRALSLALNRQILVNKVMKGGQRPAFSFVSPGLGGYSPSAQLTEDAAEARRLLAEAGFPGGKGFPVLELVTWGAGNLVLEAIQQRWRTELGISVSIVQREAHTHFVSLAKGDYALGHATAIPDYDSPLDVLQRLVGGDPGNYPQWRHAGYDRLLAARELTAAEQVLLEELPLIPLYFNNRNYLVRPSVRGWREDALWTRYYKHVFLTGD
jgi:oligopeptide transport system substrate-binding protein